MKIEYIKGQRTKVKSIEDFKTVWSIVVIAKKEVPKLLVKSDALLSFWHTNQKR